MAKNTVENKQAEIVPWEEATSKHQFVNVYKSLVTDISYGNNGYGQITIYLERYSETDNLKYIGLRIEHVDCLMGYGQKLDKFEIPNMLLLDALCCPYRLISVQQNTREKNYLYLLVESSVGHQLYLEISKNQKKCKVRTPESMVSYFHVWENYLQTVWQEGEKWDNRKSPLIMGSLNCLNAFIGWMYDNEQRLFDRKNYH